MIDDYVPALIRGEDVIDLSSVLPDIMAVPGHYRMNLLIERFADLRGAIEAAGTGAGRSLTDVRLRAPVPRPVQMLFAMGNYHEGLKGTSRPLGLFLKASSSILDPGGTVVLPSDDAKIFHHEAEIAVVIGKECKDVAPQDALDQVFGYTGIIDVSARGMGAGVGFIDKSFETFCPMGPWITLKDEIPDPQDVAVRFWEDDQPRQDYHTGDMEHPIRNLIAYASHITRLYPGDIIACGTNHQGLGPMQDGETSTLEVEGVGRLTVKVSDPHGRRWPMEIDPNIGRAIKAWRKDGTHLDPATSYAGRIV
ncbi:fumarylacetoacetate hydrolase family protein [Novosphingobium sp. BL-52-GroH]|uniref:fumarylacetoacetate hydrolase family protein n=1 Tax=Novosphingobium sp. BL-52-GroH TaxID=3349877 RepID=UPI00384B9088